MALQDMNASDLKNVVDTSFGEGKEEGIEIGKEEKELEVILNAHDAGLPIETSALITKKTIAEVEAILRKVGRLT